MVHEQVHNKTDLGEALLDIAPKLLRRLGADLPLDDASGACPGWREVVELRATPGQLTLLHVLVEHDCCTMQELAEHLTVAHSTATALVKRLLAQGYVERGHDDVNWRTVWVKPTEPGRLAVQVYRQDSLNSWQGPLHPLTKLKRTRIQAPLPPSDTLVTEKHHLR